MVYKLGSYLRELRGDNSLREIANRSNNQLSHNYVRDSEKGITSRGNEFTPSPEKLKVFAQIYNVSYSHLMRLAGYSEETPEWASHDDVIKVEEILDNQAKMTLNGKELPKEETENIQRILHAALWERLNEIKDRDNSER